MNIDMTKLVTAEAKAAEALAARRADAVMDRLDFAKAVAAAGLISYADASDWAAGNMVPAQVQAILDAMPEAGRGPALVDVLAQQHIRRNAALMPALAAAFSLTEQDLDALFGIAP
jgi:hypothetical protein